MKNSVLLSLTSERDGSVIGNLAFGPQLLRSIRPASVNAALKERGDKNFWFMGPKYALECSFPLKVRDQVALLSLVENGAQARFIEGLDGQFSVSYF